MCETLPLLMSTVVLELNHSRASNGANTSLTLIGGKDWHAKHHSVHTHSLDQDDSYVQIIGATAGAVIAFFMPALIALKNEGLDGVSSRGWATWLGAWLLLVVGVLQCIAGIVVTFKPPS
jgi:hypothetical protein